MDTHVRKFGLLSIAFGLLGGTFGVMALVLYGGIPQLVEATETTGFGVAVTGLILFNLVLAIPTAVLGYLVMQFHEWARPLMIIVCALHILNVPFGSMFGAYGLWVLLTPETEPLFRDPPPHLRARGTSRAKPVPKKGAAKAESSVPEKRSSIVPSKADMQP